MKGKLILLLEADNIINPIIFWFEINRYNDKNEIMIKNLVKTTWMYRYNWPTEINYDQGS